MDPVIRGLNWAGKVYSEGWATLGQAFGPAGLGWIGGRYLNMRGHGLLIGVTSSVYNTWVVTPLNNQIKNYSTLVTEPTTSALLTTDAQNARQKLKDKQLSGDAVDMLNSANYMLSIIVPLVFVEKFGARILASANQMTNHKATWLLGNGAEEYTKIRGVRSMILPMVLWHSIDALRKIS